MIPLKTFQDQDMLITPIYSSTELKQNLEEVIV